MVSEEGKSAVREMVQRGLTDRHFRILGEEERKARRLPSSHQVKQLVSIMSQTRQINEAYPQSV